MLAENTKNLIQPVEGIIHPDSGVSFARKLDTFVFAEVGLSKELTPERVGELKAQLADCFVAVAPDLGTFNLASDHVSKLVDHAIASGASTEFDLLRHGAKEFYKVGKYILGPLWAAYVDTVLAAGGEGDFLFAARDATPLYWASQGLIEAGQYNLNGSARVHVDWNRWFMAQEDELDESGVPLTFQSNPMLKTFYEQMGFCNGKSITIVEPGAWGSAANALKTMLPDQQFELWFLFSHMPDRIYGFLNESCPSIDPIYFEIINDSGEAVPKPYIRPTKLTESNGVVVADISGKIIKSPFIKIWSWAVNQGALEAGLEYQGLDVQAHVEEIIRLSQLSAQGVWTGVLPRNTLTWTEGEKWIREWSHGKIPPLK